MEARKWILDFFIPPPLVICKYLGALADIFGSFFTVPFSTGQLAVQRHFDCSENCLRALAGRGRCTSHQEAEKRERKAVLAQQAQEKTQQLIQNGDTIVYTDGLAKWEPGVGCIAGYGCHEPGGWETSSYLPPQSRQSVNRAELHAVIDTIIHYSQLSMKVVVAMDSAYVHNGL